MNLYDPDRTSERWHLLRKVFLLFLLVVALALGLVFLARQRSSLPLLLFNLLADASLGLLIGVGTRLVLRDRNWFIQGIASAAMSIVGLAVLGYFTDWKSGIGPLHAGLVKVNWLDWAHLTLKLPLQFGRRSSMDLLDLAHMVVAVDTSWFALRAWKRSSRLVGQSGGYSPRVRSRARARPVGAAVAPNVSIPQIRVPVGSSTGSRIKRRKVGRPSISRSAASAMRPSRGQSGRWNPLRRKPEVQLAVYEEHRCPYCLEDVNRNDPRGVVECQVCHTLHHKDCWDITGTCQVPHLNT